tara:strand:+ start:341 stop:796 length:456 start_codon:yes stop_codon:yes gene_type:complete
MADLYGVNRTLLNNVPEQKIPAGEQSGRIRVAYDSYTTAGAIGSDVINLMKIPKGARILDVRVKHGAHGNSGTLDIGWLASDDAVESEDLDGFFNELAVNAAGSNGMEISTANAAGNLKSFSAEVQVTARAGATNTGSAAEIALAVYYVID